MASPADPVEQLLRVAVDSSPSGLLMTDAAGRIVLVNREIERMFGYAREELLGQPVELLLPERLRERHVEWRGVFSAAPIERRMGEGRELFARRKDGSEVPVEVGLTPLTTRDGTFVSSSVVDISARKRAEAERSSLEEQLRQSQKLEALGRLAGGIAHDFNNILSAVVGYTEVLRTDLEAGIEVASDLDGLLTAAERGREVTSRVLRFSRRQALALGTIDLVRTVEDAAALLRAALPATVRIELDLDHPDPAVADPGAIHTILMNLGTNASHAMPDGGTLRVVLSTFYARDSFVRANPGLREGTYVKLSVTDTGLGMDEETRSRAFEPFFTTKPVDVGTGLGLATVHGMMRDHGGTAWLESAPGAGTSVHCLFRAVAPDVEPIRTTTETLALGRGERVLFVDDEPTLAALGARRLGRHGYDVVAAAGPLAALEWLRGDRFHLLVTDYTMPEMDGVRLAREARRLQPDLRIVMLSGRAGELDAEALRAAGIRRTIEKPVSLERLTQALRAVLEEAGEETRAPYASPN